MVDESEFLEIDENQIELEAQRFVDNMLKGYELFGQQEAANRSAGGEENSFADYFNNLEVGIAEGIVKKFPELSSEEKKKFLRVWAEKRKKLAIEKINNSPETIQEMKLKNDAAASSFVTVAKSKSVIRYQEFQSIYTNNYLAAAKNFMPKSVKPQTDNSKSFQDTLNALQTYYKWGRILRIAGGGSSASSNGNWGHVGMLSEGTSWNSSWEQNNYSGWIATSAWGYKDDDLTKWDNSGDREVQREPVALWLNKVSGNTVNKVYFLKVGNYTWGLWIWDKWTEASSSDHENAKKYAKSKIGVRFAKSDWECVDAKSSTSYFICSSLMYHAWRDVNTKYNLSGLLITPDDVYNSEDTKLLIATNN